MLNKLDMAITKVCTKCGVEKQINRFSKHPSTADKRQNHCNECRNQNSRLYRIRTNNNSSRKYEKTENGFLMRVYRNMYSRVSGIQKEKSHLYAGMELLPKETFYEWSKNDNDFKELFTNWTESGYDRKLSPSIDRIDSSKGYVMGNIRWITHSENSRLGAHSRYGKCYFNGIVYDGNIK